MTAARYLYRDPKHTAHFGPWLVLTSALATAADADRRVAEWNRRDAGRYLWRWEECLPSDFDFPLRSATPVAGGAPQ